MVRSCQLILSPPDVSSGHISRSGCFPPLGILGIATSLRDRSGIQAEIIDGEILSFETIAERLRSGLVGFSVSQLTYTNSVALARIAKERGATVIFGGHHATALADCILLNQPSVDAIVIGDGEEAFVALAIGTPFETIPNLAYRDHEGRIHHTVRRDIDLAGVPIPDRSMVSLAPYMANFRRQNPNKPFQHPFSVWTQKGCAWRAERGGCSFCARTDTGWRARDPRSVWREVETLCDAWGADYIWELSDDILSCADWFEAFAGSKPAGVSPAFMLYARPGRVTAENTSAMVRMGAYEVFLGIESGDDSILRRANRGSGTAANLRAAKFLAAHGLKLFPSFVLGLEGETRESLQKTEEHLLRLLDIAAVDTIAVCHFMPLPGSPAYAKLLSEPDVFARYAGRDYIPLTELQAKWYERFCSVSVEDLTAARERMIAHAPVASGMGVPNYKTCSAP